MAAWPSSPSTTWLGHLGPGGERGIERGKSKEGNREREIERGKSRGRGRGRGSREKWEKKIVKRR